MLKRGFALSSAQFEDLCAGLSVAPMLDIQSRYRYSYSQSPLFFQVSQGIELYPPIPLFRGKPNQAVGGIERSSAGGFPNWGISPFFSGKVQIVSRTLSGLFLVGAFNRPRKRKGTNREDPRRVPEQIGKIPEKSGKPQKGQERTKKDKQGRTSPDREAPPPFETPRLAALEGIAAQAALWRQSRYRGQSQL